MEFIKYDGIKNIDNEKKVHTIRFLGFDDPSIEWCVMEKAHGSNFSVYKNKNCVKFGRREGFLKDGEKFFNYQRIKEYLTSKIEEIYEELNIIGVEVDELILFGELIGGSYPHDDVEEIPNVKKVQKGVFYCPDISFYCFDIVINGNYIDMHLVEEICDFFNLLYAKILFTGTFDECLEFPNKFQTKIPEWMDLPAIKENFCEGIVIKPINYYCDKYENRFILKNKNEKFKEKSKEPKKINDQKEPLTDVEIKAIEEISKYVNENRLRNVLSKFGEFTNKDFNQIFGLFKADIYKDCNSDSFLLKNLTKFEKRRIDKEISKFIVDVWRPIFLKEVN